MNTPLAHNDIVKAINIVKQHKTTNTPMSEADSAFVRFYLTEAQITNMVFNHEDPREKSCCQHDPVKFAARRACIHEIL